MSLAAATTRGRRCSNGACAERATFKCARCQVATYCGEACQAEHWRAGHDFDCVAPLSARQLHERLALQEPCIGAGFSAAPGTLLKPDVDTKRYTLDGLLILLSDNQQSERFAAFVNKRLLPPTVQPLRRLESDFLYRWLDMDAEKLAFVDNGKPGVGTSGNSPDFARYLQAVELLVEFAKLAAKPSAPTVFAPTLGTVVTRGTVEAAAREKLRPVYLLRLSATWPFVVTAHVRLWPVARVPPVDPREIEKLKARIDLPEARFETRFTFANGRYFELDGEGRNVGTLVPNKERVSAGAALAAIAEFVKARQARVYAPESASAFGQALPVQLRPALAFERFFVARDAKIAAAAAAAAGVCCSGGAYETDEYRFESGALLRPLASAPGLDIAAARKFANDVVRPEAMPPLSAAGADFLLHWLELDARKLAKLRGLTRASLRDPRTALPGGGAPGDQGLLNVLRGTLLLFDEMVKRRVLFFLLERQASTERLKKAFAAQNTPFPVYLFRMSTTVPRTFAVDVLLFRSLQDSLVENNPELRKSWLTGFSAMLGQYVFVELDKDGELSLFDKQDDSLGSTPSEYFEKIDKEVREAEVARVTNRDAAKARMKSMVPVLVRPGGAAPGTEYADASALFVGEWLPVLAAGRSARPASMVGAKQSAGDKSASQIPMRTGSVKPGARGETIGTGAVLITADGASKREEIEIGRLLGAGDIGEVYSARAPGTELALKVFYEDSGVLDFLQELYVHERMSTTTTICRAGGPAVCAVFSIEIQLQPVARPGAAAATAAAAAAAAAKPRRRFAIAFPFLNSVETLLVAAPVLASASKSRIDVHKSNVARLARIVSYKFFEAIAGLHAANVYHLDVKGDNVVVTGANQVSGTDAIVPSDVELKMIDFGSSCALNERFDKNALERLAESARALGVPEQQISSLGDSVRCVRRQLFDERLRGLDPKTMAVKVDILRTALTLMRFCEAKGGFPGPYQLESKYEASPLDAELYSELKRVADQIVASKDDAATIAARLEQLYKKADASALFVGEWLPVLQQPPSSLEAMIGDVVRRAADLHSRRKYYRRGGSGGGGGGYISCDACGSGDARHVCGGCEGVAYCSAQCGAAHWDAQHSLHCALLQSIGAEVQLRTQVPLVKSGVSGQLKLKKAVQEWLFAELFKSGAVAVLSVPDSVYWWVYNWMAVKAGSAEEFATAKSAPGTKFALDALKQMRATRAFYIVADSYGDVEQAHAVAARLLGAKGSPYILLLDEFVALRFALSVAGTAKNATSAATKPGAARAVYGFEILNGAIVADKRSGIDLNGGKAPAKPLTFKTINDVLKKAGDVLGAQFAGALQPFSLTTTPEPAVFTDKSTRGFNADVIIIDEAAFISHDLMMDTIIPVMGQTQTALLAISTALDEGNHYSALTKLEDRETGEPLFNVIRVGQVCEPCAKTTTPWLCNHMAYDIPPWKSAKKQRRFQYIYEGQQYRNLRENFGVIAGSGRQAFKNELVDRFAAAPPYRLSGSPRVVFLAADPGGGGPSDLAMTGMVRENGVWCIMALVATTVRGGAAEEQSVVLSTVENILRAPEYRDAVVVFIPENAPAISASHLQTYVMGKERVCTMCETANRRPGVPKTSVTTRDMQYLFEHVLATDTLRYARRIITHRATAEDMRTKLETQMRAFRWDALPAANEYAEQRFKLHGKGNGENDDLMVSALMVPYWADVWYRSDYADYAPFRYYERHGYFKEYAPVRYDVEKSHYVLPSYGY